MDIVKPKTMPSTELPKSVQLKWAGRKKSTLRHS